MSDLIQCPFCGKDNLRLLHRHVTEVHPEVDWKDFLRSHPGMKVVSDEVSRNRARAAKKLWADPETARKLSESARKQWQNEDFRKAVVEKTKRQWKDPEFARMKAENSRETMNRMWKNDDGSFRDLVGKTFSKALRKKWADPEFRAKMRAVSSKTGKLVMSRLWRTPGFEKIALGHSRGKHIQYVTPDGSKVILRSQLECEVAQAMDSLGINYKYEACKIQYEIDGHQHIYLPDFLIGDKVLVEVKPEGEKESLLTQIKSQAAVSQGYTVFLVSSGNELKAIAGQLIDEAQSPRKVQRPPIMG